MQIVVVVVVDANIANFSLELFFPFYQNLQIVRWNHFFFLKICKMFWQVLTRAGWSRSEMPK